MLNLLEVLGESRSFFCLDRDIAVAAPPVKRLPESRVNAFGVVSAGIFWHRNIGCRLAVDSKKENVSAYYGVIASAPSTGTGFSCLRPSLLADERTQGTVFMTSFLYRQLTRGGILRKTSCLVMICLCFWIYSLFGECVESRFCGAGTSDFSEVFFGVAVWAD